MGWSLGITVKRMAPCRCLDGYVKEPYGMSMACEPDCRFNFFLSQPVYCDVIPPIHSPSSTYNRPSLATISNVLWRIPAREAYWKVASPLEFNIQKRSKPWRIGWVLTHYTTIPHQKLNHRLTSIIRNAFIFNNGNRRYKLFGMRTRRNIFCEGALWL